MGVGGEGLRGVRGTWGVKNFFPHSNELFIWAYPENLVKIGLMVEAMDTLCGRGQQGRGRDAIV